MKEKRKEKIYKSPKLEECRKLDSMASFDTHNAQIETT
jgi:hypothetical protein